MSLQIKKNTDDEEYSNNTDNNKFIDQKRKLLNSATEFSNKINRIITIKKRINNKKMIIMSFTFFVMFVLNVTGVILSLIPSTCENSNGYNITTQGILLGFSLPLFIIMVIASILKLCNKENILKTVRTMLVLHIGFITAWIIVGAMVLFNVNIDCLKTSDKITLYAFFTWIYNLIIVCCICCNIKILIRSKKTV